MPSHSPPPLSPKFQRPLSSSPSTRKTPRIDTAAAFTRLPRLSTSVARGGTSSAESSASGSPAVAFPAVHATNNKNTPSALHGPPSTPTDRATKALSAAARARRATASDVAASSSSTSTYTDTIEMDPINPVGHRRRRSSLMSPAATAVPPAGRNGHTRGPSVSGQFTMDEPKISEENEANAKGKEGIRRQSLNNDFSDEDLHDDEETGLTAKERKKKQRKKRRNTLLDQRIARDSISADEQKVADQTVLRQLVVNGALIALWYLFSLCISLYNKWMFASDRLNFPFPLFTTSVHMVVQFSLACVVLYFVPSFRPHNAPQRRTDLGARRESEEERPIMTKIFYLTRIGPCGAATGLDIGLGNTSLKFITLTFYTMCKSSSLAFVLIFAFLFRLEPPTWKLVAIIGTMTAGVIMMVAGEVSFDLLGFILVISAAFFSGFRWGLTQILLLRNPATSNPFSSIFFLTPVMFLTLIIIAIPTEGFPKLIESLKDLWGAWGVLTPFLLLFPGTIAFLMTACEYALLQRTSVVTLSIAGIFKEVVTISTATLVFDDKLTAINISGLCVTIGAICAYNYIKITKMRKEAQTELQKRTQGDDMSSPSSSDSDAEDERGAEDVGLLAARPSISNSELGDQQGSLVTVDGEIVFPPPQQPYHTSEHPLHDSGKERD
ncbi:unnamed protein product [Discula destructiva]